MRFFHTLFRFGIFSALLALCIGIVQVSAGPAAGYIHEKIWLIWFFYLLVGILFLAADHLSRQKGDKAYVLGVLAAVVLKFLLSGIFAAWFILKPVSDRNWFIINFFALYLCFTAFEIYTIISNLRAQKK